MTDTLVLPRADEMRLIVFGFAGVLRGSITQGLTTQPKFVDMFALPGIGELYVHKWLGSADAHDTVVLQLEFDSEHLTFDGLRVVWTASNGRPTHPFGQTEIVRRGSVVIKTGLGVFRDGLEANSHGRPDSAVFGIAIVPQGERVSSYNIADAPVSQVTSLRSLAA